MNKMSDQVIHIKVQRANKEDKILVVSTKADNDLEIEKIPFSGRLISDDPDYWLDHFYFIKGQNVGNNLAQIIENNRNWIKEIQQLEDLDNNLHGESSESSFWSEMENGEEKIKRVSL